MISFYYAETLRNITTALLERFSYMQVHRFDAAHKSVVNVIDVPLAFAPIEKTYMDRKENYTVESESAGQRYYQTIPRLALNLIGMQYNPSRVSGANEYRYFKEPSMDSMFKDYQPVPWDLTYSLAIRADQMNDFAQIIENVLPYFNPNLYLEVSEFSFLNLKRELMVTLNGAEPNFSDDLDKTQQRQMNGSVSFTVAAWFYRPLTTAKIIKTVKTSYYVGDTNISASDGTINLSAAQAGNVSAYPTHYNVSSYDSAHDSYVFLEKK